MLALEALQKRAYRAIAHDEIAAFEPDLVPGRVPAATRVRIYRNNLHETARKTLAVMYPVVQALTGERCFANLARAYTLRFPSQCGDLAAFGRHFPALLDELYAGRDVGYLADVAKLELACVESRSAGGAPVLDVDALRRVAADDFPCLRLALHPSVRLAHSPFPVYAIWRAHDTADVVAVESGAEDVLVYRDLQGVVVERITAASYVFLECLARGDRLADAHGAAVSVDTRFDLAGALRRLHELGLLTGFIVDSRPNERLPVFS